jgi:dihydrofolate reductase
MTPRETPRSAASTRVGGSEAPYASRPERIESRIDASTCWCKGTRESRLTSTSTSPAGVELVLSRSTKSDLIWSTNLWNAGTMRKIVNSTFISLDGVIDEPHTWPPTGPEDETSGAIHTDLLLACDAVLMGRRTYEGFAPVWPTRSGDPFSDRLNSMRKYVVSSTLRDPEWHNTTVITGDPIEEIRRLKAEPGSDIVQYGFGLLSHAMMRHGLLDELRLWIHPLFVGRGGPDALIYRDGPQTMFELRDATPLKSGIVILSYAATS